MSTFKLTQGRAQALALANQRAAMQAQELRNEIVPLVPVLKKPRRINGALYSGGRLRQSISVQKIGEGWFRVGTNVEYAIWVEFGTRRMAARPFLRPALEKVRRK